MSQPVIAVKDANETFDWEDTFSLFAETARSVDQELAQDAGPNWELAQVGKLDKRTSDCPFQAVQLSKRAFALSLKRYVRASDSPSMSSTFCLSKRDVSILAAICLLLVAAGSVGALTLQRTQSEETVSHVLADIKIGHNDHALVLLNRALAIAADNGDAHFYRAEVLRGQTRYSQACSDYDCYLRIKPRSFLGLRGRAWCRLAMGNYEGAMSDSKQMHRLQRTAKEPLCIFGIALSKKGHYGSAIDYLERFLQIRRKDERRAVAKLETQTAASDELDGVGFVTFDAKNPAAADDSTVLDDVYGSC